MSYPRWICLTTALTVIFTSGGLWLETRLKGEPIAAAKATASTNVPTQTEIIQATIQVLITGAVSKPGMYRLPAGSSVQTLIDLAGGSTAVARLSSLDLNRAVNAGEVLHVPAAAIAQNETSDEQAHSSNKTTNKSASKSKQSAKQTKSPSAGSVSLNRASLQELEQLPGVGPALAQRILDWRQAHGGFKSIEDLLEVKGIGPKKLEKMRQGLSL